VFTFCQELHFFAFEFTSISVAIIKCHVRHHRTQGSQKVAANVTIRYLGNIWCWYPTLWMVNAYTIFIAVVCRKPTSPLLIVCFAQCVACY